MFAVKLNPDLRKTLLSALSAGLPHLTVVDSWFLSEETRAFLIKLDALLPANHSPKNGAGHDRAPRAFLVSILDDHPLADFAADYLQHVIVDATAPRTERKIGTQSLAEILDPFDANALAEALIVQLESLPHPYTFAVPLNAQLSKLLEDGENEIPINPHMRIVRVSDEARAQLDGSQTSALRNLVARWGQRAFVVGDCALEIKVSGYCPRYGQSATVNEAMLSAKAFFGLCVALRLISSGYTFGGEPTQERMSINRADTGEIIGDQKFDQDAGHYLRSLRPHDRLMSQSSQERRLFVRAGLADIGKCIQAGDQGKRLRLAGRWFFDSVAGSDDVTAFVQAMIVLETLLGRQDSEDIEKLGVGELLRNRCAYLLGHSATEREEILSKFPAIYRVRSAIVHRGQSRLSFKERELLDDLRFYCARVIHAEGRLVAGQA